MRLATRFRLLLLIFGFSIVANVAVSAWCIRLYMDQASHRLAELTPATRQTLELRRIRGLLQRLDDTLQHGLAEPMSSRLDTIPLLGARIRESLHDLQAANGFEGNAEEAGAVAATFDGLDELLAALDRLSTAIVARIDAGKVDEARDLLTGELQPRVLVALHRRLERVAGLREEALIRTADDFAARARTVTLVLSLNALAAFLLAAAGVHLAHHWVLRPVAGLKVAAEHHAAGDLAYRVAPGANDELGMLAHEINRMADSLIEIQHRLVQQERLAAIGEVTSTVAHNIRNPLAGIRASAQSSLLEVADAAEVGRRQQQIIDIVDALSKWLRELLLVSQPIKLECRDVAVRSLLDRVAAVLAANAARRGVRFEIVEKSRELAVHADEPRLEQALLAILDNAVDASPDGEVVEIALSRRNGDGQVQVAVSDRGGAIAREVLDRIATPYFSTKPGGTGIGLHQAQRIVRAHGGRLDFQNDPQRGTTVTLWLPGAAVPPARGAT